MNSQVLLPVVLEVGDGRHLLVSQTHFAWLPFQLRPVAASHLNH
jgi:hypothetical protein